MCLPPPKTLTPSLLSCTSQAEFGLRFLIVIESEISAFSFPLWWDSRWRTLLVSWPVQVDMRPAARPWSAVGQWALDCRRRWLQSRISKKKEGCAQAVTVGARARTHCSERLLPVYFYCVEGARKTSRSQEFETRSFHEEAVEHDGTGTPVVCRDASHAQGHEQVWTPVFVNWSRRSRTTLTDNLVNSMYNRTKRTTRSVRRRSKIFRTWAT